MDSDTAVAFTEAGDYNVFVMSSYISAGITLENIRDLSETIYYRKKDKSLGKMIKDIKLKGPENRKSWIDVLRALAVLFVIYGHALEKNNFTYIYFVFTSPVKIPLFFVISGYLFKENIAPGSFLKKIFLRLVIPWLILSIGPVALISLYSGVGYFASHVRDILTGASIWYMPCCIIAEILFYYVIRIFKKDWTLALISSALTALGIFLIHWGIGDFLMANRAISVQFYMMMGFLIHRNMEQLKHSKTWHLWIGAAVYLLMGLISIFLYPRKNLDVHTGNYYNIFIIFLMIILGCIILFILGERYSFHNGILSFIGQNTLIYYIWSHYFISAFSILLDRLGIDIANIYLMALIKTGATCCVCALLSVMVNYFFPVAVGKKRRILL